MSSKSHRHKVIHCAYGRHARSSNPPATVRCWTAPATVGRRQRRKISIAAPAFDEFERLDGWVAIAVTTDDQRKRLCSAIGSPSWATDPKHSRGDIVAILWDADVPVAKVMPPHRQPELDQLACRGFSEEFDHPVNGR